MDGAPSTDFGLCGLCDLPVAANDIILNFDLE